ncbi:MAG: threonine--tRNA ligase, partial [Candidimonas sp.]
PKGWTLWQQVEQYMRSVYLDNGYEEVKAPQILDLSLWKKTGHWDNYKENMFTTESENRTYGLKPMNCPGHVQIFNAGLHSYRELPIRYGEFGICHRNEPSGSLHGMMRVRGFTQDDGHIFCTEEQLQDECAAFTSLLQKVYADFGFKEILYKVATRPEKRIGSDEVWDEAEQALMQSLERTGCAFEVSPGEGAFYGPKVEYTLKDAIGRHWQCGTLQVDFSMPGRLGAEYVDAADLRRTPVMLHRAILGSLERFIGMLIENHAGAMPAWLSPEHAVVCCISEPTADYAREVVVSLRKQGFRVSSDLRGEKITRKIREHSMQKVPYILVVGEKERETGQVAVRGRGGVDLGAMPLMDFAARLQSEIMLKQ